jgi:hypothetical protein
MTPEQFAYWLQGYAELNETPPTAQQWQMIRDHLALVFEKVTPPLGASPQPSYRWAEPATSGWGHGAIMVSGDTATRLVC